MKILSILCLLASLNLWAQCPAAKYKFKEKPINYSKVFLIPGAGSENDDLYLGHIRYGKYYAAYIAELEKRNIPFEVIKSSPTGNESVDVRTKKFIRRLEQESAPVLVIGHSMGGLVARLALRNKKVAQKVAATVTISTPHDGTAIIDWLLTDGKLPQAASFIARAFGFDLNEKEYLRELSVAEKSKWNTDLDHQDHIQNLYSVVAAQDPTELLKSNPLFALGDRVLRKYVPIESEKQTDGLITRASQSWGECLLFVTKNHGSVVGIDVFQPSSRDVLPLILDRLANKGIDFI